MSTVNYWSGQRVAYNVMSFKQFGEALGVELNYLFRLALYNC